MLKRLFLMVVVVCAGLGYALLAHPSKAAGVLVVTTFEDVVDEAGATGLCSLRQAVRAANLQAPLGACTGVTTGGATVISLPEGTYVLTRTTGAQSWMLGALVITQPVQIVAQAPVTLTGDVTWNARILTVGNFAMNSPEAQLFLSGVRVQGGRDSSGFGGGGIAVGRQARLVADWVTLFDNTSTLAGGGLLNFGGRVDLTRTVVFSNTALFGAGVYNANPIGSTGILTISHSSIISNAVSEAERPGGGIFNDAGVMQVRNTTISHNRATSDGGGVFAQTGSNNTFNNVTIVANQAALSTTFPSDGGGGVRNVGVFRLANSVLAGNLSKGEPDDCLGTALLSLGYNLVQAPVGACFTPIAGDLLTGTAPLLDPLTFTAGQWIHRPQVGSPLLLAGNPNPPTGYPQCDLFDQLGVSRASWRCDIGAVRLAWLVFAPFITR